MPWCPRCDETFPQGPACPRCNARLVAREHDQEEDALQSVPGLRSVKVSRRYLRALERLNAPRQSSARLLALALVLLVFASGYLIGRVGSVTPSQPTVRALPAAEPLPLDNVKGSVSYLHSSRDSLATIAQQDLFSGDVIPRARISLPPVVEAGDSILARVVTFGRSVAVVLDVERGSYVAFSPHGDPVHAWVPGVDAAWISESELAIRDTDGVVTQWTASDEGVMQKRLGEADRLIQSPAGAVVLVERELSTTTSPARSITLPAKVNTDAVAAVSADLKHVVLSGEPAVIWDGTTSTPVRAGEGELLGASFDRAGERVAVVSRDGNSTMLSVSDLKGNAALKPLPSRNACETPPVWDGAARWIYVPTSDGMLHAAQASGGRIESIETRTLGCGIAWLDTG